jgi:hypothetical protein
LNKYHDENIICEEIIDKKMEEYAKKKFLKKCPSCNIFTQKSGGCNHITCSECNYQWCWLCDGQYNYNHYLEGKCRGFQFFNPKNENDIKLLFEGKIILKESERQLDINPFENHRHFYLRDLHRNESLINYAEIAPESLFKRICIFIFYFLFGQPIIIISYSPFFKDFFFSDSVIFFFYVSYYFIIFYFWIIYFFYQIMINILSFFLYLLLHNLENFYGELYDSIKRLKVLNFFVDFVQNKFIFEIVLLIYYSFIFIFFESYFIGLFIFQEWFYSIRKNRRRLRKYLYFIGIIYWVIYFFLQVFIGLIFFAITIIHARLKNYDFIEELEEALKIIYVERYNDY